LDTGTFQDNHPAMSHPKLPVNLHLSIWETSSQAFRPINNPTASHHHNQWQPFQRPQRLPYGSRPNHQFHPGKMHTFSTTPGELNTCTCPKKPIPYMIPIIKKIKDSALD